MWTESNDAKIREAHRQTLIADASSVEAQLAARLDIERARLHDVSSQLSKHSERGDAILARLPVVVAGLDRLWSGLTWLDNDMQMVARAKRATPMRDRSFDE